MNRAYLLASALAASVIGGAFTLNACARTPQPANTVSASAPVANPAPADSPPQVRIAAAPTPAPLIGKWQAGTNYTLLANPLPTGVAKGKVEVDEVFWYGCGHCYALDPALESWKGNKPAFVEFVRIPVVWGPVHKQHAKLFYTLQALGRGDLHAKVFDAIHQQGKQLAAASDEEARKVHLAFFKDHGVTEKDFNAAYDSMSVAVNVQKAEQFTSQAAVASVPLMVVNGKYSTGVSQAGGTTELLALVNDLAASEKNR
jgi:thiol:disulfide interchange protein DsbA